MGNTRFILFSFLISFTISKDLSRHSRLNCCPWGGGNRTSANANTDGMEYFDHTDKDHIAVTLNLNQGFIPTVRTVEDSGARDDFNDSIPLPLLEGGSGRLDIYLGNNTEDHGILTINDIRQWPIEWNVASSTASETAPYGSWRSPISSEMVTAPSNKVVEAPRTDPITGFIFWLEELEKEEGRHAVIQFNQETSELIRWTSKEFNLRSRVHEHGGGTFQVYNNTLVFSNEDDFLYKQEGPEGSAIKLTNTSTRRYADGCFCPQLNGMFWVVEDHDVVQTGKAQEPENGLVLINLDSGNETVVAAHADFFASPRVTEDGTRIAWLQWNHPQMPWGSTRMFVGTIVNKKGKVAIAKYFQHGSMLSPLFSPNNELFYVHDSTGWWNLYIVNRRGFEINLLPEAQEVGWPQWKLGQQPFALHPMIGINEAAVISGKELILVDVRREEGRVLETGYSTYSQGVTYSKDGDKVYVVAGDEFRKSRVIEVNLRNGTVRIVQDIAETPVTADYLSQPIQIQFPTTHLDFVYGYLYLPKNPEYAAPEGTKPPLLVKAHNGPTDNARTELMLEKQFYTSRGWAVLDVDYRGSTGYGSIYRNKLNEMWGVFDRDDCIAGANYLVKEKLVDPEQLAILGHGKGGFTALSALTYSNVFKAGATYDGTADLEKLVTSKFESHYLDMLIGKIKDFKERYVSRSPVHHNNTIDVPTIFFRGSWNNESNTADIEEMYKALQDKELPTASIILEGTSDYLDTASRQYALEAEMFFFATVFHIKLPDVISNIEIDNLEKWKEDYERLTKLQII